jgi:hypothetical protein
VQLVDEEKYLPFLGQAREVDACAWNTTPPASVSW